MLEDGEDAGAGRGGAFEGGGYGGELARDVAVRASASRTGSRWMEEREGREERVVGEGKRDARVELVGWHLELVLLTQRDQHPAEVLAHERPLQCRSVEPVASSSAPRM